MLTRSVGHIQRLFIRAQLDAVGPADIGGKSLQLAGRTDAVDRRHSVLGCTDLGNQAGIGEKDIAAAVQHHIVRPPKRFAFPVVGQGASLVCRENDTDARDVHLHGIELATRAQTQAVGSVAVLQKGAGLSIGSDAGNTLV